MLFWRVDLLSSRWFPQSSDSHRAQHPANSPIAAFYLADFQLETPSSSAQFWNRIELQSTEWAVTKHTGIMLIINGVAVAADRLPVHWGLDMSGTMLNAGCVPK